MRLAMRELMRRPARFVSAGGPLTLLVLLMLFLGWLLDGLFLGSTGAIRAHGADGFVFSADARESLLRSSVDEGDLNAIAAVDGVESVSGIGVSLLGAEVPGEDDAANVVVAGYQLASDVLPDPPAPGTAWADRQLNALGAGIGDVMLIGPAATPIEIVGWVDDTNYLLLNTLWVDPETWREIQNANRPDAIVAPGEFQVAAVTTVDGVDEAAVRSAIDATLGTETLTEQEAVLAIPGVPEQNATIGAVIYATAVVVALVVGLFFALITLERTGIYALLKAIGVHNRSLAVGLVTQALLVALVAFIAGGALGLLLGSVMPAEIPLELSVGRAVFVLIAVAVAAVAGSLASLRRIVRIDPASAIGAGV